MLLVIVVSCPCIVMLSPQSTFLFLSLATWRYKRKNFWGDHYVRKTFKVGDDTLDAAPQNVCAYVHSCDKRNLLSFLAHFLSAVCATNANVKPNKTQDLVPRALTSLTAHGKIFPLLMAASCFNSPHLVLVVCHTEDEMMVIVVAQRCCNAVVPSK